MNWIEIIVSAAVSLAVSLITTLVIHLTKKIGNILISCKFTGMEGYFDGWGFYGDLDGGIKLQIPAIFEILNSTNSILVMRNVNLVLFKGKKEVSKLIQITSNFKGVQFGSENGSYSFVIAPHEVKKYNCFFALKIRRDQIEEMRFDSIGIVYSNENNKVILKPLREADGDWEIKNIGSDTDWILVK